MIFVTRADMDRGFEKDSSFNIAMYPLSGGVHTAAKLNKVKLEFARCSPPVLIQCFRHSTFGLGYCVHRSYTLLMSYLF